MTSEQIIILILASLLAIIPTLGVWMQILERKRITEAYEKEREVLMLWIQKLNSSHQAELERLISKFFVKTAADYIHTLNAQQKALNYIHEPIAESIRDKQFLDKEEENIRKQIEEMMREEEDVIQRD